MTLLRTLRRRLTALNAVVSSVILIAMVLGALLFTHAQFSQSAENAFAHAADTIAYQLQSGSLVRHSYLANTELSQRFVLYIEDGGEPFQWQSVYDTKTPRATLIERARAYAEAHGVPLSYAPSSSRNVLATIAGDWGDTYRLSVWSLADGQQWSSVIILGDMSEERASIARITWIFAGCALAGIAVQIVFSRLFARRAIRPVERADAEQKRFMQAASHELRTPLAVIRASADALGKADAREAEAFAGVIRAQTRHMGRLVDDMLLLASADAGEMSLHFAPVELDALLRDVATAFAPIMRERSVRFECPPPLGRVLWGDAVRLAQALYILLDNAAEHTPPDGTVALTCKEDDNRVLIAVSDSGPGIPDEHKSLIFERFYRIDKARGRSRSHYGLGLSVAREIVLRHGGNITVADCEGGGAVFTVFLPLSV